MCSKMGLGREVEVVMWDLLFENWVSCRELLKKT
jgi:hypothetical protein